VFVSDYNFVAARFIDTFDYRKAPAVTIIVGNEGLGKTTLLDRLYQKLKEKVIPAILIDAGKYAAKYSFAACNGELNYFRRYFRSAKLLLFDNLDLLRGKKKTIEELLHTLDTILSQGGKTVLTFNGNDLLLEFLGERLASHLKSGLVIHLQEPTPQEIQDFIQYYLKSKGLPLEEQCYAGRKFKNMKQVIEALEQKKTVRQDIGETANLVLNSVCNYYQIEKKKILGPAKSSTVVQARYMVYLLLHEKHNFTYKEIAAYFKKDASGLKSRALKYKERHQALFESLCQKLYNTGNSSQLAEE